MRQCAGLVAAVAAGLSAGCSLVSSPAPRVWAAGDMVQLTDRTPPSAGRGAWDGDSRTVRLVSAANETVSFQLVIDAPPSGLEGVAVSVGTPVGAGGKLPPESVALFRMWPAAIERFPAWYLRLADGPVEKAGFYDMLAPMKPTGERVSLPAGGRLAVWVDLYVPRGAAPGEYVAPIAVSGGFGKVLARAALKVHDFVLPDIRPVPFVGGFSHETIFRRFIRPPGADKSQPVSPARMDPTNKDVAAALVVIRQLMRLGHEHRLDLFDRDLRPLLKRDAEGRIRLVWEDYDAIVKPYLDGTAFGDRVGVSAWPAPVRADWPDPANYGGPDGDEYRQTVRAALQQTLAHYQELKFPEKLFLWPRTGGTGGEAYARHRDFARQVRAAGWELPILSELPPWPPEQMLASAPADFATLADAYAPSGELIDPARAAELARPGEPLAGLWLRPGLPPYLGSFNLLSPPADIRALPWLAVRHKCAGLFLPEVLNWDGAVDAPDGSESRLFYPSPPGAAPTAYPSVRLKRLRRGMQDVAYLWLLLQRQRGDLADDVARTMVRYAGLGAAGEHYLDARLDGWVRDGPLWSTARALLAEEIVSAIHPRAYSQQRWFAHQLALRQFRQQAGRLRVEKLVARIDPLDAGRRRATIRAELYNEMTSPVEAELRIESLPEGWSAAGTGVCAFGLGPGGRTVVELSAEGGEVATDANGRMPVGLTLTVDGLDRQPLRTGVPFLVAGRPARPIAVDGELTDWPARDGNTAADFLLLGRRGQTGAGLARRPTAVFALRDERNLYLAFRCDEPAIAAIRCQPSNIVRYEQLMAAGEDLVEVILDPGRGARLPEELYHVVVKCNGAVLTERGVQSDPPLGRQAPWPCGVRAAVGRQDKVWIVELAIPLSDLGPRASEAYWGVNFARFATGDNESSSWTGATRHFFNPAELGTLYLGPAGAAQSRPAER